MILVRASAGLRVPMEGAPRRYITDQQSVSVPKTSRYYQRCIADGDLQIVEK
ncbi:MAG TPA: DUF2635 domain-containing protein [Myxococcota bacterium]|nr:DUF2635 domain-containing protein [Myxococcota bacterium]